MTGDTDHQPASRLQNRLRRRWPALLVGALVVTLLTAVIVAGATSGAAFGLYNSDWDGASEFRSAVADEPGVEAEVLTDTAGYEDGDPNATVAVVVAPEDPYTGPDADRVETFLAEGGTLLVLENFGATGNDLLDTVGAEARVDGRLALDENHYETGPAMPIATTVTDHERTTDVEQLSLNYASAIEPGNATVLVATSEYGYLGTDPDDEPDDETQLAAHPVATTETVGNGTVVTIADPSIAVNVMYGEPDNAAFLAAQYADADRVLFDASHGESLPPLTAAVLTLRSTPALQVLVGLTGVIGVGAVARRRVPVDRWLRSRLEEPAAEAPTPVLSEEDVAAIVREHNPNWDDERVHRMIGAFNSGGEKREGNE